uniref:Uncharacterized protein n=1 Tax=Utricularia reniformis TaxID=192314 RepID=A0A1Y0AYR5_9LAMI|nr:hypothetical protein AEK19_MT0451 [Utricularia reniformis]ART30287.1 hypothetical protein AEK19_MT0451 [Utricularia reniformis]
MKLSLLLMRQLRKLQLQRALRGPCVRMDASSVAAVVPEFSAGATSFKEQQPLFLGVWLAGTPLSVKC